MSRWIIERFCIDNDNPHHSEKKKVRKCQMDETFF